MKLEFLKKSFNIIIKFPEYFLFFLSFFVRIFYFYFIGVHPAGDTHFYVKGAEIIINNNYNILSLKSAGYSFYYWLYPFFLAVLNNNQTLVVLAQIILQSIAAVLIFKIVKSIFNFKVGLIAGVIYSLSWEIFQWDMYVLTDSLFLFLVILVLYIYANFKKDKSSFVLIYFLMILLLLLRPIAIPFLASFLLLLLWNLKRNQKIFLFSLFLLFFSGLFIFLYFKGVSGRHGVSGYFSYFVSLFEKGVVIRDREQFNILVDWGLHPITSFLKILINRLVFFWAFFANQFSFSHKIFNLAYLGFLYFFSLAGFYKAFASKIKLNFLIFFANTIVFYWFFHSLTEIDHDWRYRLPVLPFLIILSSYGFYVFINFIYDRKKNFKTNI